MKTFKECIAETLREGKYDTDKDCGEITGFPRPHVYADLYEIFFDWFEYEVYSPDIVLEIGVNRGGCLKALSKRFPDSLIIGVDPHRQSTWDSLEKEKHIKLYQKDGYSDEFVNSFLDESIDILIDDGPHTIDSQIKCISQWSSKIKKRGLLIIEDIESIQAARILHKEILLPQYGFNFSTIVDRTCVNSWGYDEINLIGIK